MAWWNVGGITSCQCALQFIGAPCLPIALLDLTGNGNNATLAGTTQPTWDNVNGLKGNGSGYASIPVTPGTTQNWSVIVKFTNHASGGINLFGIFNSAATGGLAVAANYNSKVYYSYSGNSVYYILVSPGMTAGCIAIAGNQGYRNGLADGGTQTQAAWTASSGGIFLLAGNLNGSAADICTADIQAFAIYNTVLSAAQVAAITAAMNALAIPAALGAAAADVSRSNYYPSANLGAAAADVSRSNYYPSANLGSQAAASTKRYFYPVAANLGVSATTARRTQYHPVAARIGDSAGVTWTINENNIWGDDEWNPWAYGLNHPFRLRRIRGLQRMTPYAPHGYDQ
jgi:hypothetical protein